MYKLNEGTEISSVFFLIREQCTDLTYRLNMFSIVYTIVRTHQHIYTALVGVCTFVRRRHFIHVAIYSLFYSGEEISELLKAVIETDKLLMCRD